MTESLTTGWCVRVVLLDLRPGVRHTRPTEEIGGARVVEGLVIVGGAGDEVVAMDGHRGAEPAGIVTSGGRVAVAESALPSAKHIFLLPGRHCAR